MDFPEHRDSVLQLCHADDPTTFGTAFIVHVDPRDQTGPTAYLVTCAHVVDDCCNRMMIGTIPVSLVGIGRSDELDIAVVEVARGKPSWQALPLVGFVGGRPEIEKECFCAVGFRETAGSFRCVALNAEFGQYEDVAVDGECQWRLIQFRLPMSSSEQPKELAQGYSGAPLLAGCGVCGVVDLRERTADHGTWKIGTAIPLWHLPKIWPTMPNGVGEMLFSAPYWPILEHLRGLTVNCTVDQFCLAFRRVLHDERPEEYSLWGCAVTLAQFENEDQPVTRLRRFVQALADVTNRTDLLTGASLPEQEAVDELPAATSEKTYRRLIVRIVEQRVSARSDRQRGRRYQVQVHTATCQEPDGRYCGKGCADCAAPAGGRLKTVWARSLEDTSESGLRDILAEEIEDIVGIFGSELPDLVQIMAPEGLLAKAIFEMCLDQLQAAGPRPLCLLHPTVFSGESRSNRLGQGRYLLPRIGPPHSQWTGARVRLQSIADERDLYRQLDAESITVAVTSDRGIAEECLYSPVPVIVVAEDSVEPIEAVIDATECLHRLPHTLHKARLSHRLVYDNPRIGIEFAEGDSPHVDGK